MDFSTVIIIVVVLSVVGGIVSLLFWIGLAYFGFKAVQGYQRELDAMMTNYQTNIAQLQDTYGNNIPPAAQQQMLTRYLQAQGQMRQFDRLSQERQDLVRSDMLGQASAAGIDVSRW